MLGVKGFSTEDQFGGAQGATGCQGPIISRKQRSMTIKQLYDKYCFNTEKTDPNYLYIIHIWYEFYMLFQSARTFEAHKKEYESKDVTEEARFVYDSTLECFLVHLRVLLEFFRVIVPPKRDDKICYDQFTKEIITLNLETIQKGYINRLNTEISHLSTARVDCSYASENWQVALIANKLKEKCQAFMDKIRTKYLPENFLNDLEEWRSLTNFGITFNK